MITRPPKRHYLEGHIRSDEIDGRAVITTWTTHRTDANREATRFQALGARLVRVSIDNSYGFRIIGHW